STVVDAEAGTAALVVTVHAGSLALISRSEVKGNGSDPPAVVLQRAHATAGSAYRRRQIDEGLTAVEDSLRSRGYYQAQATAEARPAADGVAVTITVDTGPLVQLRVEPPDALPGRLEDLIPIKREGSADLDLLEDAKAEIERQLKRDGYATATAPFTRT